MPDVQHLTVPSTECITNKIQELYNMFESQASTLNDQQLKKINSFVDSSLKELYRSRNNSLNNMINEEPANKNVDKQVRFYSTKKTKTKAPEERRLNKPTLKVVDQIKNDLKSNEKTPYLIFTLY